MVGLCEASRIATLIWTAVGQPLPQHPAPKQCAVFQASRQWRATDAVPPIV